MEWANIGIGLRIQPTGQVSLCVSITSFDKNDLFIHNKNKLCHIDIFFKD